MLCLEFNMNQSTILTKEVIDLVKGTAASLIFEKTLEDGTELSWLTFGLFFDKNGEYSDIDMDVVLGSSAIPQTLIDKLKNDLKKSAGDDASVLELSLAYNGNFGFSSFLSVYMGKEAAGKCVAVLYYDSAKNGFDVTSSTSTVGDDGYVKLLFKHASDYMLVAAGEDELGDFIENLNKKEVTPAVAPVTSVTVTNDNGEAISGDNVPAETEEKPEAEEAPEESEPEATDSEQSEETDETDETDAAEDITEGDDTESAEGEQSASQTETGAQEGEANPETGVTVTLIPAVLAAAIAFSAKRSRKQ